MNCAICKNKQCRIGNACIAPPEFRPAYDKMDVPEITKTASSLIDNGRAGTLSRLEETVEFIKKRGYLKVGIAYCFAFDSVAEELTKIFKSEGIPHSMVSCTAGALLEKELDNSKTKNTVSCNPIGQAMQLEKDGVDFIVEIGLCMGHDVLFHRHLHCDFTVLAVKDRVFGHCPLKAFSAFADS